jgi:lipid A 4'-phosphatase
VLKSTIFILFIIFCIIGLFFPGIDLIVSGWFYRPGIGFYLQNNEVVLFLYNWIPVLGNFLLYLFGAALLFGVGLDNGHYGLLKKRYVSFYLLMVLILGPGLIVNKLVKDHSGRARPEQIQQFGGDKIFSPALSLSDQCEANCSFVSGHASVGFFLCAIAFVDPSRRKRWLTIGVLTGSVFGLARVMQGRHYFFDIIFCFFIVYFTAWFVDYCLRRILLGSNDKFVANTL